MPMSYSTLLKRLANYICLAELLLLLVIPMATWIASVLGTPVANLFTEEALRWVFRESASLFISKPFAFLLLILILLGTLSTSGILLEFRARCHRKALYATLCFLGAYLLLLVLPILLNYNPLLSIKGTLFPSSPWLSGFPFFLSGGLITANVLYAVLAHRIRSVGQIPHMLAWGFAQHAVWIIVCMLGQLLLRMFSYCFSNYAILSW